MIGNILDGAATRSSPHFRVVTHEVIVDFASGNPVANDNDCIIGLSATNTYILNLVKNVNRVLYIKASYVAAAAPLLAAAQNTIAITNPTISEKFLGQGLGTYKVVSCFFASINLANGSLSSMSGGKVHFQVVMQQNEAQ
jgi:hypothetical protein